MGATPPGGTRSRTTSVPRGGTTGAQTSTPSALDLAQVSVHWLWLAGQAELDRQADGNSCVPSPRRGFAMPIDGLQHEVAFGSFFGRELDHGTCAHAQPGQSRWMTPPYPDEDQVGQRVTDNFNHHLVIRCELLGSGAEYPAVGMTRVVETAKLLSTSAADTQNVQCAPPPEGACY